MKATLVNVDARFNIALRRLWSCYEAQGWEVEEIDLHLPAYPHERRQTVMAFDSDAAWVSNLFDVNKYRVAVIGCPAVDYGGIGSRNPDGRIPDQAEAFPPHYGPDEKTAYGFLTRGCVRGCWFCKVPKFEGALRECDTIQNIVGERREVVLMDNNLLAYHKSVDAMEWMIGRRVRADINQGLDWRLVDDDNLDAMSRLRHVPPYTFAFDDLRYLAGVTEAIGRIREHIPKAFDTRWYCYFHPDSYGGLDGLARRVEWCREHEALPYVMRDAACWGMTGKDRAFLWDYTAWCNQPGMWKRMTFPEFVDARHPRGGSAPDMAKTVYRELEAET